MSFASAFSRSRRICCALLLGTACLLPATLRAQSPGTLDTSFLSVLTDSTTFAVTYEDLLTYYPVKNEPDEAKPTPYIPAGGDLDGLYILADTGLAATGYAFPDFGNVGRIVYVLVPEIVQQFGQVGAYDVASHKILVGGSFGKQEVNKVISPAQNITRITVPDGSIDTTFNPGTGADDFVTSIIPFPDGTMLVGGLFSTFDKQNYPRLVRLNNDGSIDTDFASVPMDDGVFALAQEYSPATGQFDGKILVGGVFSTIGGNPYTKLARIDLAGNLDTSFRPVIDSRVLAIATQPDGKIVIGGEFSLINGQAVGHIARLNQDGSLDTTFNATVNVVPFQTTTPVAVYTIKLLPDGRMYVGGQFSSVDGVTRNYLARVESDGFLDTSFDPGTTILNSVESLAVQDDFKLLVGETLSKATSAGVPASLVRLYAGTAPTLDAVYLNVTKAKARVKPSGKQVNGRFEIVRSVLDLGGYDKPLTVYFQLSGSAQIGTDYKLAGASQFDQNIYGVTIPAGQASAKFKIKPKAAAASSDVVITLVQSQDGATPYEIGFLKDGAFANATGIGTIKVAKTP